MFYKYRHLSFSKKFCLMGETFEKNEPMSATPMQHCPDCGDRVERVIEGGQRPITNYTPTHHV